MNLAPVITGKTRTKTGSTIWLRFAFTLSFLAFLQSSFSQTELHFTVNQGVAGYEYSETDLTITFMDTSKAPIEWSWTFDDTNSSTAQNPVHSYDAEGSYNACLKITDANGCKDSVCKIIDLLAIGLADFAKDVDGLLVFPNPFTKSTQMAYHIDNTTRVKLAIFDAQGRLVQTIVDELQPPDNYEYQFTTAGETLSNGVYLVKLALGDKEYSYKLVERQ